MPFLEIACGLVRVVVFVFSVLLCVAHAMVQERSWFSFFPPTTVIAAKELSGKNKNGKSDPYVEVTIFDDVGNKAAAPQMTQVVKEDLNPKFNQTLTL
jgi:hypothetical protein